MNYIPKRDDGRATNRQSRDFNEIWNVQTDMAVSQEKFDSIFHNWEDPLNCNGRKRGSGCTVCDYIDKYGYVIKTDGTQYAYNVAFVGDIHGDLHAVENFINNNPDCKYIISVGDIGIYCTETSAQADKKSWAKYKNIILNYVHKIKNNKLPKFKIKVYSIIGNHDDYDNLYSESFVKANIHYLKQGGILTLHGVRIGHLGGIYSRVRTQMDPSSLTGRHRRFYSVKELNNLLLANNIDILITHEAASGILPQTLNPKMDEGKGILRELVDTVQPDYYIHGHHHVNYTTEIQNANKKTTVIGLGNFGKNKNSFVKFNLLTKKMVFNTN